MPSSRPPQSAIRVLLADDSMMSRFALKQILEHDPGLKVVAEVATGEEAVRETNRLRPDIVLMDVMMPGIDGIDATARIMMECPVPVIIVTDFMASHSDLTFRVLETGALEVARKPSRQDLTDPHFRARFCRMVRALARVPVVTRRPKDRPTRVLRSNVRTSSEPFGRVCIGASTGGPPALVTLLKSLGPSPPWPIFIVQHMASGFFQSLATWLGDETGLSVRMASSGCAPEVGVVYLAPEGRHLLVERDTLEVSVRPMEAMHRPSIDVLFDSVVSAGVASTTLAVLLTGMGNDGALGLGAIRAAGGFTIAQDEATCVVYGMPKVAVDLGCASEVLPLVEIGPRLLTLTRKADGRRSSA